MVGRTTVIEQDLLPVGEGASCAHLPRDAAGALQSIAVGNYANDHHYPGPDWPLAAKSCRWGGRWTGTPFCIPYGALVSVEIDNLLAADKAISTSHMANGATRLQPLVLNVGQAAGAAAALAVRLGVEPGELPPHDVQRALIGDSRAPSAVMPLWDTPWHHSQWRERQEQALFEPGCVTNGRVITGSKQAPASPNAHEQIWAGRLSPDGSGGFSLATAEGQIWPVITLEPALHAWLQAIHRTTQVELIGRLNPWGPWIRASRLAG